MKLYKIKRGILIKNRGSFYLREGEDWDRFVNDDALYGKLLQIADTEEPVENGPQLIENELEPPIGSQELWACGVTYYSSKLGRQEESRQAGGSDYYASVYDADRPELFFKSTRHRVVGSGGTVRIRRDSTWDVPEPELTLLVTSNGRIVGYTIGNDMSSRSIEGENPLYLPQAKTYDGSASVGPSVYVTEEPLPPKTQIRMQVLREEEPVFEGEIEIDQIKRSLEELVEYLYRECSFPYGSLLMTGTGIVPGKDFTLHHGDEIRITVPPIGTLINRVK